MMSSVSRQMNNQKEFPELTGPCTDTERHDFFFKFPNPPIKLRATKVATVPDSENISKTSDTYEVIRPEAFAGSPNVKNSSYRRLPVEDIRDRWRSHQIKHQKVVLELAARPKRSWFFGFSRMKFFRTPIWQSRL